MKKAAVPALNTGQFELDQFAAAVKQNIDAITAQARNVQRLQPLPETATLAQVIERLNVITARLQ
jgi:glucose-6-phosphate-specific signal transduction histidine kinase